MTRSNALLPSILTLVLLGSGCGKIIDHVGVNVRPNLETVEVFADFADEFQFNFNGSFAIKDYGKINISPSSSTQKLRVSFDFNTAILYDTEFARTVGLQPQTTLPSGDSIPLRLNNALVRIDLEPHEVNNPINGYLYVDPLGRQWIGLAYASPVLSDLFESKNIISKILQFFTGNRIQVEAFENDIDGNPRVFVVFFPSTTTYGKPLPGGMALFANLSDLRSDPKYYDPRYISPGPPVEITLLHTNDIHSRLKAEKENTEANPYGLGGLARLKTLVNQIRSQKPNVLLLDGGDWSEGNSYFSIDAGTNMLQIFDQIGYNGVVVGNHDFLNGPNELANLVMRAAPHFAVLGANKDLSSIQNQNVRNKTAALIPDYTIVNVGGVKVALVGLLCTDPEYQPYFHPANVTNVVQKVSSLTQWIHTHDKADMIVLISHNFFENNLEYAKQIPWVNVVVSGHSHVKTPHPIIIMNAGTPVYVAETGQYGQFLGEMNLVVDKQIGEVNLKNYSLHPVSSEIPEDLNLKTFIEAQDKLLIQKFLNTSPDITSDIITNNVTEMVKLDNVEAPLANLIVDSYRTVTQANMALEIGSLLDGEAARGTLSTLDIRNISPHVFHPLLDPSAHFPEQGHTWTLHKLTLSGFELKSLLNIILRLRDFIPSWISISGAHITYDAKATDFSAIKSFEILDPKTNTYGMLDDAILYTVTLTDGSILVFQVLQEKAQDLLKSLGARFPTLPIGFDTGIETWRALLEFLRNRSSLNAADFQPGTRYIPTDGDLGFYPNNVEYTNGAFQITLFNEGLAPTPGNLKFRILHSPPNDPVNDSPVAGPNNVDNVSMYVVPDQALPIVEAGHHLTLEIPFHPDTAGVYSFLFQIIGNDANPRNNTVRRHFFMQLF